MFKVLEKIKDIFCSKGLFTPKKKPEGQEPPQKESETEEKTTEQK